MHKLQETSQILEAYRLLARTEGVFAEPGSIASIAGLIKFKDMIEENSDIVCILTGNGLKDPTCAIEHSHAQVHKTSSNIDDIVKIINSGD